MKDNESELFKRYRTVNRITSSLPLMTERVNETVHVISVTPTSYNIYDVRKMNLIFCGPTFSKIHCTYQKKDVVYVGSYRTVYSTVRGEVIKSFLLSKAPAQSNKRVRVSEETEDIVRQITGFGGLVLILTSTELIVTEDLEENYKIEHEDEIVMLFHPHTYLNKVIEVMRGGRMVLFNISSRKEIYSYKPFCSEITSIEQTAVIDIVGVGLKTGAIHIFNLKTDKILFSFKVEGAVNELSFGESHFVAITSVGTSIFDLNEKKRIIYRENVSCDEQNEVDDFDCATWKDNILSGRFLDDKSLVVSTWNSVSIYEIGNYKLDFVKGRKTYNDEVVGMEFINQKNVVLFGPGHVFGISLYKDEQSFEFKFKGHIEMVDVNENIVCFGKGHLYSMDFSQKNSKFVTKKDASCIAVYKDFCSLGEKKIITLINLRSKLVHSKFKIDEEVVDLAMDFTRIAVATSDGIRLCTFQGVQISKHEQIGIRSVKMMGNFVTILTDTQVLFYDEGVSRVFTVIEGIGDYCVSSDMRWIAILCKRRIHLYDILTTSLLDILSMNEEGKFIRFSPKLDFLLVVFKNDDLVMFSNKSYFSASKKPEEVLGNFSEFRGNNEAREMKWERMRSGLCMELLLLRGLKKEALETTDDTEEALHKISPKTLDRLLDEDWIRGLGKEQVLKIMGLMLPHMNTSMDMVQRILFNLLKHKSHLLEPTDVYSFHERFDKAWTDFEQNALKTIGYLNMEANGLL